MLAAESSWAFRLAAFAFAPIVGRTNYFSREDDRAQRGGEQARIKLRI